MTALGRVRRMVVTVLLAVLTLAFGAGSARAETPPIAPRPVVVIGVPGLAWEDITRRGTPALWQFGEQSSVGALVTRAEHLRTCPGDGWLTLGTGVRGALPRPQSPDQQGDPRLEPQCPADQLTLEAALRTDPPGWLLTPTAPGRQAITVVDGGAIIDPDSLTGRAAEVPSRADQVRAMDERVRAAIEDAPQDAIVIVAGISDDGAEPGLRALLVRGEGFPAGWMASDSTGRVGLAQTSDVTATALVHSGRERPAEVIGRELTTEASSTPFADRREVLIGGDGELRAGEAVMLPFFVTYGALMVALIAIAAAWWWRSRGDGAARLRLLRIIRDVTLVVSAIPLGLYWVTSFPWWEHGHLALGLAGWTGLMAFAAVGFARLTGQRWWVLRPAVVAALTLLALTTPLLRYGSGEPWGDRLFLSTLGLHPLDGGRFRGFGNVPFAVFAVSLFLAAIWLTHAARHHRRRPMIIAAVVGGLGVIIAGAPQLGADGGSALALVPAVGYLVLAVGGIRVTWLRAALLGLAGAAAFLIVAGLDHLRPEASQTHLGRFFGDLLSGEAGAIIWRKLDANLAMLFGPEPITLLVPVGLIAATWYLTRVPKGDEASAGSVWATYPTLRPGLIATVVALVLGFALNDSGTAIPPAAAMVLIPAVIAIIAGHEVQRLAPPPEKAPRAADQAATGS